MVKCGNTFEAKRKIENKKKFFIIHSMKTHDCVFYFVKLVDKNNLKWHKNIIFYVTKWDCFFCFEMKNENFWKVQKKKTTIFILQKHLYVLSTAPKSQNFVWTFNNGTLLRLLTFVQQVVFSSMFHEQITIFSSCVFLLIPKLSASCLLSSSSMFAAGCMFVYVWVWVLFRRFESTSFKAPYVLLDDFVTWIYCLWMQ